MQKRFEAQPTIKGQSNGADLFPRKLVEFAGQIAPIVRGIDIANKEEFLCWLFGHMNGAFGMLKTPPVDKAVFSKEQKSNVKLREEFCLAARGLIQARQKLERQGIPWPFIDFHSPIDAKGVDLLQGSISHCEEFALRTAHLRKGDKAGPKKNFGFEGYLKGGHLELSGRLVGKKYSIQPLAVTPRGKLDRDFFERQRGAGKGQPKLPENQYYASALRLLANGYYLSGMSKPQCKESHLRKVLVGFRKTMGEDAHLWDKPSA